MSFYRFMGYAIGEHSFDWHTFILNRRNKDLKIRKYPNCIAVSTAILMDLVEKGTKLIIIRVDGKAKYKTTPDKWLNSKVDQLAPDQDPHAFMNIREFEHL